MQVKCNYCNTKSERSDMYCDEGKQRKYFHHSCWTLEQERRHKVAKESIEWDSLYAYLKRLYGFNAPLPPQFIHVLQDLRNGTVRYKGPLQRGYKEGVPYQIILNAYKLSEQQIIQAKSKTDTFENDFLRLKYGFSIMLNYLNQSYAQWQKQVESEKRIHVANPMDIKPVEYKKAESKKDISAFLEE